MYRHFFNIILHFVFIVHLGKYDFSFAIEYCLISHKFLDREKMFPKNISEILIYSQLSLSRLRLSRITAYLEEKCGPCYNTEI